MNERIDMMVNLLLEKEKPGSVRKFGSRLELNYYLSSATIEISLYENENAEGLVMARVRVEGVQYNYPFTADTYRKAREVADEYFKEKKKLEEEAFEKNASVINKIIGELK